MTVRQMLASMDSAELCEWMAFERLESFGALIEDMRVGQVAAVVANVNRNAKERPEPYRPSDFMPALGAELTRSEERAAAAIKAVRPSNPKARSDVLAAMLFGRLRA